MINDQEWLKEAQEAVFAFAVIASGAITQSETDYSGAIDAINLMPDGKIPENIAPLYHAAMAAIHRNGARLSSANIH